MQEALWLCVGSAGRMYRVLALHRVVDNVLHVDGPLSLVLQVFLSILGIVSIYSHVLTGERVAAVQGR